MAIPLPRTYPMKYNDKIKTDTEIYIKHCLMVNIWKHFHEFHNAPTACVYTLLHTKYVYNY